MKYCPLRHHKIYLYYSSVLLVLIFMSLFSNNALASQRCYMRIAVDPDVIDLSDDDRSYLVDKLSSLPVYMRKYAKDSLEFYIPRSQFSQARIDDLIYTIRQIEKVNPDLLTPDIIYATILNFASIEHENISVNLSRGSLRRKLFDMLVSNFEEFKPLIRRHVRGYNFIRWYGLCANGSAYALYDTALRSAALLKNASAQEESLNIPRTSIRVLSLEGLSNKRLYFSSPTSPAVRYYLEPCDMLADEVKVLDFRFNPATGTWENEVASPSVGGWYQGGYGDLYSPKSYSRLMTRELFDYISQENENRFLTVQQNLGLLVQMPAGADHLCRE